jgi:ABC-type nitrate/sulfonate/bicarbonate transport system permease component
VTLKCLSYFLTGFAAGLVAGLATGLAAGFEMAMVETSCDYIIKYG